MKSISIDNAKRFRDMSNGNSRFYYYHNTADNPCPNYSENVLCPNMEKEVEEYVRLLNKQTYGTENIDDYISKLESFKG